MNDFIANLYEVWGTCYLGDFSKFMYNADLYLPVFLWMVLLPVAALFVYYKVLDNILLAKRWVWCVLVVALAAIVAGVGYGKADTGIYDYMVAHNIINARIASSDYLTFCLIAFGWTVVWALLLSLAFAKTVSTRCRYIPF